MIMHDDDRTRKIRAAHAGEAQPMREGRVRDECDSRCGKFYIAPFAKFDVSDPGFTTVRLRPNPAPLGLGGDGLRLG
jgi:hypothetical protein